MDHIIQRLNVSKNQFLKNILKLLSEDRWKKIRDRGKKSANELGLKDEGELYALFDNWRD